jgi:hypothetical protein
MQGLSPDLPEDLIAWIRNHFSEQEASVAMEALRGAVDHKGEPAGPRLLRCAAVGSRGKLERLLKLVKEIKRDYRDVIVAGEYRIINGKLTGVHKLSNPISPDLDP